MANVWRFAYESSVLGDTVVNVFHYQTDLNLLSGDEPSASEILDTVDDALREAYRNVVPEEGQLLRCVCSLETDPNAVAPVGQSAERAINQNGNRTTSDAKVPRELCCVIKKNTALAGRSFRGHNFMPPLLSSTELNGERILLNNFYGIAVNGLAAKLDDVLTIVDFIPAQLAQVRPVVYSRTRRARNQPPWTADVVSTSVPDRAHWLRSRGA